jgi:peptidoglycan/LPS O-acetylase OafA/YrhL
LRRVTVAADAADRAGGAATTGSGRVGNVDVLRAVAAFGVLVGHAYALGGRPIPIQAQYWYDVPLAATTTGVWLFFAISGYVISRPFVDRLIEGRPLPELVPYALRRGFRIFPLYWVALTAFIVMVGLGGTQVWQVPFHYALLQNVVPGQQEALLTVAWTLTIEVLFYVAVPLLAVAVATWLGRPTAERLALWVCLTWIASIGLTLVADMGGGSSTATWLRGLFPMQWQMFCPGILIAIAPHLTGSSWRRWIVNLPRRRGAMIVALGLIIVAAIVSSTAPLSHGLVLYVAVVDITRPLYAVGYGLILAAAIRSRPWSESIGGWVLTLGLVSYGIYLFHAVLGAFFSTSVGHEFVPLPYDTPLSFVMHVIYLAGLTIPLAILSWRWLERPMLGAASTLSERWRAAQSPAPR